MTKQELMDEILARIPVLQNIQGCRDEINTANAQLEALGAEEPIIRFLKLGIGCIGGIVGLAVSALVINVIELLFPMLGAGEIDHLQTIQNNQFGTK